MTTSDPGMETPVAPLPDADDAAPKRRRRRDRSEKKEPVPGGPVESFKESKGAISELLA